ncbi:hypothetical protein MMC31_006203 [Peltigera leucophlebia]|nr:hypothetical protein [Peltigera leucophlebia]
MPWWSDDAFVSEEMDDGEDPYYYRPGGLHPVHLGDQLDDSRYKVVQKLGHGASSTVWLARDCSLHKYVAVKIKQSELSNLYNELDILKHLSKAKSDHPGRIYSSAYLLLRHFWIDGPNGRHLALVFQVRGPSISRLRYWGIRLHTCLAQSIAIQVTQGLEYLHSEGICHGDLNSSNVVLHRPRPWTTTLPSRFSIFLDAEPRLLTKNITIVDHSESFFKFAPSREDRRSYHYTAPEVLFGWNPSFHSDIWALGCLIFEMRAGYYLFSTAIDNPPLEAVGQIVELLGKTPSSWNNVRFNEEGYLERDGCQNPETFDDVITIFPLHTQVNHIKDEQIGLPNVNIGLRGSKTLREFLRKPSSLAVNGRKIHSIPNWRPIPLPRTGDMYLIGCSSTQLLDQAAIKKDMAPFQISVKESTSFTDLLSKILTYKPEDRISLSDITEHPWLTASVESTQKTPFISS